jgi:dTDP-4-dehydrorhamnose reductase
MIILILGGNGMLGRYLVNYLENFYTVYSITRADFDIYTSFTRRTLQKDTQAILEKYTPNYVINCCGIINKRPDKGIDEMFTVNAYFPLILSKLCERMDVNLIHPSTDCVFSGLDGEGRSSYDLPNPKDTYGVSKALSENNMCMCIRASIIGEEENNRSLVEWVKSSKGTIQGYTNHIWNGITCLEYAHVVREIIQGITPYREGICTIACKEPITKYELVKSLVKKYKVNCTIEPVETEQACDRSLIPDIIRKDILEQIDEM